MDSAEFWTRIVEHTQPSWVDEAGHILDHAERRRRYAQFNTGSISLTASLALRAICAEFQPKTVVEVGTFIGVSTFSLRADHIYTCDISNDCVPSRPGLTTHPYTKATDMFRRLVSMGVQAELFFFDGLLSPEDRALIVQLSVHGAVYVVDDYYGTFKGKKNVELLLPSLPGYVLLPASGPVTSTTLAALVPGDRLS